MLMLTDRYAACTWWWQQTCRRAQNLLEVGVRTHMKVHVLADASASEQQEGGNTPSTSFKSSGAARPTPTALEVASCKYTAEAYAKGVKVKSGHFASRAQA